MKTNKYHIAILPGDGIGPEIMAQAYKVLDALRKRFSLKITTHEYPVGGIAIDIYGNSLPDITLLGCKQADAILFGAVGGPKWNHLDLKKQPEYGALLTLRNYFNLFINLRPVNLSSGFKKFCILKRDIMIKGFNILCVRELIGGIYFGQPKGRKGIGVNQCGFDTEIYHQFEVERIARVAFNLALNRHCKITSVDKANVLESSRLWREVVNQVSKDFPSVVLEHLYVDNAIMQIMKNPSQFDVILCSNFFGDIISEACAAIIGSIGLLPSASLNEFNFGLYEPSGGSAPDIAGKNIANPISQILSLALLLRFSLKLNDIAEVIEHAVNKVLEDGYYTFDLNNGNKNNYLSTNEMGDIITTIINKGT